MPFFGRKKEKEEVKEEVREELKEIKKAVEEKPSEKPEEEKNVEREVTPERPVERRERVEKEEVKPATAPLFIKLERYHSILSSITEIKKTLLYLRTLFSTLLETEKLREESIRLMRDAIGKLDRKIASLDSLFLRPPPIMEEEREEIVAQPEYGLGDMISSLKSQISKLKEELETIR